MWTVAIYNVGLLCMGTHCNSICSQFQDLMLRLTPTGAWSTFRMFSFQRGRANIKNIWTNEHGRLELLEGAKRSHRLLDWADRQESVTMEKQQPVFVQAIQAISKRSCKLTVTCQDTWVRVALRSLRCGRTAPYNAQSACSNVTGVCDTGAPSETHMRTPTNT